MTDGAPGEPKIPNPYLAAIRQAKRDSELPASALYAALDDAVKAMATA